MTKKRVRAPSTIFGQWEIRYHQVPYDNRYFDIFRYGQHVLRLPRSAFRNFHCDMFVVDRGLLTKERLNDQLAAFWNRVLSYDMYLDSADSAGDTTFALKA